MTVDATRLRRARNEDAQDLFGLLALCFAEYPGCYVDPHDDLRDLRRPGESFSGDGEGFWVVDDPAGRVAACVAMDLPRPGSAELHRLYVRPDRRGTGLGAHLTAFVEDRARVAGAVHLVLWSDTRFDLAHRLYRRLGFADTGELRDLGDVSGSRERRFEKVLRP